MKKLIVIASAAALLLSACTKKEETAPAAPAAEATPAAAPAADTAAVDPNATPDVEVTIGSVGNNLAYDKTEFTAKAGQIVRITMKNNGTPDSNMFHNVVVARPGTEAQVANDGIAAGEANGWVQAGPNVVAHTPLAKPGESTTVTFRAPAAGEYPYICTFPGHAAVMKGVMKVQ